MLERDANRHCHLRILERALAIGQGELGHGHPMVLSCGGIFVPRPQPLNPREALYHILNTPNTNTPAKIVSALVTRDLLDEILLRIEGN
ncbi:MAG: hypothetical protein HYV02_07565 [Deltaproteobacteria bacterium]|nr:hypothetical protein [Deltaproteobacteria bacterium]